MVVIRTLSFCYGIENEGGKLVEYLGIQISGGYFRQVYLRKGHEDIAVLKSLLESSFDEIFDLQIPKNGVKPLKRIRIEQLVKEHNNNLSSVN